MRWVGKLRAPTTETYRLHVEAYNTSQVELIINGNKRLIFNDFTGLGTTEAMSVDIEFLQNALYDIEVRFAHKIGPHKLTLLWESDTRDLEVIPSSYYYYSLCSENTPFILQVVPDISNATTTTLTPASSIDIKNAIVGVKETQTITARDRFRNLQNHKNDVFKITIIELATGQLQTVTQTSVDLAVYSFEYTLMTVGEYKVDISIQFNGLGSFYALSTSPFYIQCHVTTTDPSKTIITGDGKNNAVAGIVNGFLITVFDEGGNQQQIGGDTVSVTITSTSHTITDKEIFDNNDGTYRVKYELLDASETYLVSVVVNGDTANTKTSTIVVVPNKPDPRKSTLVASSPLTIAADHTFKLQIFDSFSNPIQVFVPTLSHIIGAGQDVYATGVATQQSLGKYDVTFNIPRVIAKQESKCGLYSYQAYILQAGGLVGQYYTNKWFSGNEPYLTKVDTNINLNWGQGDIIPNVAKDYVSVVWKGYLKPVYSEAYTFYCESNDGVRVYVNDQIVIDRLVDSVNDLDTHLEISSTPIALESGKLVPITVMYYETTGNAMIALYW